MKKPNQIFAILSIFIIGMLSAVPATSSLRTLSYTRDSFNVGSSTAHYSTANSDPDAFISIWDTTLTDDESSNYTQVRLPLETNGTYDFTVTWEDGSSDTITSWDQTEVTHTYTSAGIYTINITGTIHGWRFDNEGDCLKIIEIQQWGALRVGNAGSYFLGCENLNLTTTDTLDLTGTTTLFRAFHSCVTLGSSGNLNAWDVSNVTDMRAMFYGNFYEDSLFNQTLDEWDVSSVTSMELMFCYARSFNQTLNAWDVSSVKDMYGMFYSADSFNQPLGAWDTSSVIGMGRMFYLASSFNQPLDAWNVSSVQSMRGMFYRAPSFNQPLNSWDVSSVTDMHNMFRVAKSFNQPLDAWNVSSVMYMSEMFTAVTLSTNNYDSMLVSWSQLPLQSGVVFDAGNSQYSTGPAATARQRIIDTFGWTITDGGPDRIAGFLLTLFGIIMLGSLIGLVRRLRPRRE